MMNVGNHGVGVRDDDVCVCAITLNLGDNGVCIRNIALNLSHDDAYVCNIVSDLWNNCMCVGGDSLCLRDTVMNVRRSYIYVQQKFGLGVNSQRWPCRNSELTLKTRRILSRSILQLAII